MIHDRSTRCVHAGTIHDPASRGVNSPIYTSTAYEFIDAEDTVYPRYLNTPNEKSVAAKLAALEEAEGALVFSSGMAAISTVIFALLKQRDHIVFQKGLYGGTLHFIENELPRFGIDYTIATSQEVDDIMAAVNKNTRMIYLETPSNPLLKITDLSGIAKKAREKGILTITDNTFASPVNQQPIRQGIDMVIHSATKYLGGHSDICAGAVATRNELLEKILQTGRDFGGSLNALTLHLLERSMKTLDVRMQRINSNAQAIAEFLAIHPAVARVNYPGLPEHPGHQRAAGQMYGFSGMLSFELKEMDPMVFQKKLQLITPAISLGGVESLVSSPSQTSHRYLGPEGRKRDGIAEGLIRFSTGIESRADLIEDLGNALDN